MIGVKPMIWRGREFPGNTTDDALAELARLYVHMDDSREELRAAGHPAFANGEIRESSTDVMDNEIRGYEACLKRLHPEFANRAFDVCWARGLLGVKPNGAGA